MTDYKDMDDAAIRDEAIKRVLLSYNVTQKLLARIGKVQPAWDEMTDEEKDVHINKELAILRRVQERERKYAALPEHVKEQIRAEIAAHQLEVAERDAAEAKDAAKNAYEAYRENAKGRKASEILWHNPSAPIVPTTPWDEIQSEEDKRIRQKWEDFVKEWTGPDIITTKEDYWVSPTAKKYLG